MCLLQTKSESVEFAIPLITLIVIAVNWIGYKKQLLPIKWGILFKKSMFISIKKHNLCGSSISGTALFSAEFSLSDIFHNYFSWKVLEQLWICCQQVLLTWIFLGGGAWSILLAETILWGLGKNQRLPQDQRGLARKYNEIGDAIQHGHTNMFIKYSHSFRGLASKTTKCR